MARLIHVSATAALALLPAEVAAHAFGQRYDLPLPLTLWIAAAGATVAFSFLVFALLLRPSAGGTSYPRLDLLRPAGMRVLVDPFFHDALRACSVGVFVLLIAAGLFGTQDPYRNIAPTFVWIVWWIGFTYLSATAGNLWALLNPWKAIYLWAERIARKARPAGRPGRERRLPAGVGAWPATVLLLAFAWLEIVWHGNSVPASIAYLVIAYSALTWTGMFVFGREPWLRSGEVFSVYFGLLARLALTEARATSASACAACTDRSCRSAPGECVNCYECFGRAAPAEREWNLRPPAAGLHEARPMSTSRAAFVIVMLAIVTFDGVRETPLWGGLLARLSRPGEPITDFVWSAAATTGLLLGPGVFALVILGAGALMAALTRENPRPAPAGELVCLFVPTLLPIAFAYHVAHYLSYLLIAGQLVIPLSSDPFGWGWDIFGTAHYKIDVGIVGARFAWYTSVAVIVLGHVLAMYVAHRLALARFSDTRTARRSQYPLAALMVAYTMLSLWILAQPIVEGAPGR